MSKSDSMILTFCFKALWYYNGSLPLKTKSTSFADNGFAFSHSVAALRISL
jgi:hypothetical protein